MRLVKVLTRVLSGTIVEIIKHQIHILLLLNLKVIVYFCVPVHLDLYMCISLATQSSWLGKVCNLLWYDNRMLCRLPRSGMRTEVAYITCITSLRTSWLRFRIPANQILLLSVCSVKGIAPCFHHSLIRNTEVIVRVSIRLCLLSMHRCLLFSCNTGACFLSRAYILPHALPHIEVIAGWLQYHTSLVISLYIELWVFALSSRSTTLCSLCMVEVILCQCETRYIFVGQIRCR